MAGRCQFCCPGVPSEKESYTSHNNVFGPSIDELVLSLFFLLATTSCCQTIGITHKPCMKGFPECFKKNDLSTWLSKQVTMLAEELHLFGYDLIEPGPCPPTESMLQARKYVLNELAELMERKDDLERNLCKRPGIS